MATYNLETPELAGTPVSTRPSSSGGAQTPLESGGQLSSLLHLEDVKPAENKPAESGLHASLTLLLKQSDTFNNVISRKFNEDIAAKARLEAEAVAAAAASSSSKKSPGKGKGKGRGRGNFKRDREEEEEEKKLKRAKIFGKDAPEVEVMEEEEGIDLSLVTGAVLRDYQRTGVIWLATLFENGLNGILADEMGLGKTLQTIAFLAHLRAKGIWGPFLIVVPFAVLDNWVVEFARFAPSIPVLRYHGADRGELRSTHLGFAKGSGKTKTGRGASCNTRLVAADETTPIIITTYEIIINDALYLKKLPTYSYIIVDESHRLKNFNCKLIQTLKQYPSENRLLLTGTPLHNNLSELWSLLSYIMPATFDDCDLFVKGFDFTSVTHADGTAAGADTALQTASLIAEQLHRILKPYMLRRLKNDVEKDLPKKKEYVLSAPLTIEQKETYDAIKSGRIREFLLNQKVGLGGELAELLDDAPEMIDGVEMVVDSSPAPEGARKSRKRKATLGKYKYVDMADEDEEEWLQNIEMGLGFGMQEMEEEQEPLESAEEQGRAWAEKEAKSKINGQKLQNKIIQLRKAACHPFLFEWPRDSVTGEQVVDERLLSASGKMLVLDRLLDELLARGHKVLIFSQFTTMIDVIHEWANSFKGWPVCRIDGSVKGDERNAQVKKFNQKADAADPDDIKIFLLSTRAGGVGINLTGADTVIIFDSDWNPQSDLQAIARSHRIGQTKPVLIFRLVTAGTVEALILKKANEKRKLEALVIGGDALKGDFSDINDVLGSKKRGLSIEEVTAMLQADSSESVEVVREGDVILTDDALNTLLDRSDEAMTLTGSKKAAAATGHASGKVSFEVMDIEEEIAEGGAVDLTQDEENVLS